MRAINFWTSRGTSHSLQQLHSIPLTKPNSSFPKQLAAPKYDALPTEAVVDNVEDEPISFMDLDVDLFDGRPEPLFEQFATAHRNFHAVVIDIHAEVIGHGEQIPAADTRFSGRSSVPV